MDAKTPTVAEVDLLIETWQRLGWDGGDATGAVLHTLRDLRPLVARAEQLASAPAGECPTPEEVADFVGVLRKCFPGSPEATTNKAADLLERLLPAAQRIEREGRLVDGPHAGPDLVLHPRGTPAPGAVSLAYLDGTHIAFGDWGAADPWLDGLLAAEYIGRESAAWAEAHRATPEPEAQANADGVEARLRGHGWHEADTHAAAIRAACEATGVALPFGPTEEPPADAKKPPHFLADVEFGVQDYNAALKQLEGVSRVGEAWCILHELRRRAQEEGALVKPEPSAEEWQVPETVDGCKRQLASHPRLRTLSIITHDRPNHMHPNIVWLEIGRDDNPAKYDAHGFGAEDKRRGNVGIPYVRCALQDACRWVHAQEEASDAD
jgi:hypothetical protein